MSGEHVTPDFNPHRLEWSQLIGKYVLVGITTRDAKAESVEQRQFHGFVRSADPARGVEVELVGQKLGKQLSLPPDLRSFLPAKPGVYRLRETGEEVYDPDYLTTWILDKPAGQHPLDEL